MPSHESEEGNEADDGNRGGGDASSATVGVVRVDGIAATVRLVLTEFEWRADDDNDGAYLVRAADILPVLVAAISVARGLGLPPVRNNRINDNMLSAVFSHVMGLDDPPTAMSLTAPMPWLRRHHS